MGEEPLPEHLATLLQPWKGDFGEMAERRVIRALVTFSMTGYFLDGATQRGITYEVLKNFEETINKKLKTGHLKMHVVLIPVGRDQLIPGLVEGRGDIAAANLTITPERSERVDFSHPVLTGVDEIVVMGPAAPEVSSLEALSGQEIHVRASSSYHESLKRLNRDLERLGLEPADLVLVDEYLEDEDLLEMVNAGLIPMVVVDRHKAEFWDQIFPDISLRPDLAVGSGGAIAWAFRKDSPGLKAEVDAFVKENKKGTLMGNILFKRYLQNTKWVVNSLSEDELDRFQATVDFFRKYGAEYGFDWLMLAALGYQESRLDQSVRSPVGAIGVMQVMPATAADRNVNIPDIEELENNIHAGTKYLRFLQDRYFDDQDVEPMQKVLFTLASYNAGPARVAGLRRRAGEMGLDPNRWFDNVEIVAAREIGRETVQYVSNIYKYYIAYTEIAAQLERKGRISSTKKSDRW